METGYFTKTETTGNTIIFKYVKGISREGGNKPSPGDSL